MTFHGVRLAVLMTVHNRRDTTLRCLTKLFANIREAGQCINLDASVYLVDDGSTDGTTATIEKDFPSVQILKGDGSLYWNQGMRLAWEKAAEKDFDAYLWLNDDTCLFAGAITSLIDILEKKEQDCGIKGIAVGSCQAPEKSSAKLKESAQKPELTYGGRNDKGLVYPEIRPVPVTAFNGNLVLVSREAFKVLGNLSAAYRHSFGDIDYGIRAQRAGIPVWLAPGFLAECPRNPPPKWRNPEVSFLNRWRAVQTPKGWSVSEIKAYSRVRGQRWWILSLARQVLMVCFPRYAIRYQNRFS